MTGTLDRIEERLDECLRATAHFGHPVAFSWYVEDIPALVEVAKAAQEMAEYIEHSDHHGTDLSRSGAALAIYAAALARLEDSQ